MGYINRLFEKAISYLCKKVTRLWPLHFYMKIDCGHVPLFLLYCRLGMHLKNTIFCLKSCDKYYMLTFHENHVERRNVPVNYYQKVLPLLFLFHFVCTLPFSSFLFLSFCLSLSFLLPPSIFLFIFFFQFGGVPQLPLDTHLGREYVSPLQTPTSHLKMSWIWQHICGHDSSEERSSYFRGQKSGFSGCRKPFLMSIQITIIILSITLYSFYNQYREKYKFVFSGFVTRV